MNILIFAPRVIYGGGEKVTNWLAHRLISEGNTICYATPKVDSQYIDKLRRVGLYNKVTIVEYPHHLKKKRFRKYCNIIDRIYKDYKINLIVIFGGSLIEQVIAHKNGVKILLSERCNPQSRPILSKLLKKIQYQISDAYVFQTIEACHYYGRKVREKSIILPNPIIDELSAPIFENLRKEIVSVGRLSAEKNQIMLLHAFYKSKLFESGYKLIFYGSGPAEGELNEFIKQNELSDSVRIIKGETNIIDLINGAALFVLTSNNEGMPNALIEAMSMGLLSVSTDCPIYGPRMLIKHGVNGFLTPVKDEDKLSQMMLHALSHPEADKIRKEAYKIRKLLSSDNIFFRWKTLIDGLNKI